MPALDLHHIAIKTADVERTVRSGTHGDVPGRF